MNALITDEKFSYGFKEQNYNTDNVIIGDVVATVIVAFFTVFALVISGWSMVLYMSGSVHDGGPLENIFRTAYSALQSLGIA